MAAELSRAVKLCGTEEIDAPSRLLRAGALTAELENGQLRYIRIGGVEVLRAIAYLVRDENWGTFTPVIEDLHIEERPDRFTVTYRATCRDDKRVLAYAAAIAGRSDGMLSFEVVAEPLTDVETNRTGFIVLHPIKGVAGAALKVEHASGGETVSTFPRDIDPDCPFRDIRALSHEVVPGVWATCRMEGDVFEMEDQRNWSDASYKTYVRPLARPWPYVLAKGVKVEQAVRLSISGALPAAPAVTTEAPIEIAIGGQAGKVPMIGVGVPADEAALALRSGDLVSRLGPKWLVCQLDLRQGHGRKELELFRQLGALTGAEIVLEIVTTGGMDPAADLQPLADAARAVALSPGAIAVFPAEHLKSVLPGSPWPAMASFEQIYAATRAAFPGVKLGGGMATYFTELNRRRPPAGLLDYVTHTTCPNVHAADDRSVMETLECLPYQIQSTRAFMGDALPYRIGPSQLACRENPYGRSTAPNPHGGRVCLSRFDPRQRGLFNAAWTLGYVAACARGHVEAVALGAPTGPFGHFEGASESARVFPSFHVMAGLAALSGKPRCEVQLSKTGAVDAIAALDEDRTVIWLANLTAQPQTAVLPGGADLVGVLDESTFEAAMTGSFRDACGDRTALNGSELVLGPYATACAELV
jgi:hypothetical protein